MNNLETTRHYKLTRQFNQLLKNLEITSSYERKLLNYLTLITFAFDERPLPAYKVIPTKLVLYKKEILMVL